MHSLWFKYCLSSTAVSLIIFLTAAYGQSTNVKNECVISFATTSIKEMRRISKSKNDEFPEPTRLGRIDISQVSEGTTIEKTCQIPNSRLHVLVELLFDDDLSRDLGGGAHVPTDAMTIWLTVWNGSKRNSTSVLAHTINQAALTSYYFRSITTVYAKNGSKIYFVLADCTADSGKEDDKP
jgi:hypothetical protein